VELSGGGERGREGGPAADGFLVTVGGGGIDGGGGKFIEGGWDLSMELSVGETCALGATYRRSQRLAPTSAGAAVRAASGTGPGEIASRQTSRSSFRSGPSTTATATPIRDEEAWLRSKESVRRKATKVIGGPSTANGRASTSSRSVLVQVFSNHRLRDRVDCSGISSTRCRCFRETDRSVHRRHARVVVMS
jgi:hypothetical protein